MSYELLSGLIYDEALRLQWLLDSDRLDKVRQGSSSEDSGSGLS